MPKPSLDTAYALINRASEQLNELKILHDEIVVAQVKATAINPVNHPPIAPGEIRIIAEGTVYAHVPIPDKARILIGEISNNLRSSLNYLVSRLSELDSPGIKYKELQFPIESSGKSFRGQRPRYLAGISDAHVANIERLQPYNGCNWVSPLQKLSNLHKHDDLVLIQHTANIQYTVTPTEKPGDASMHLNLEFTLSIALKEGLLPIVDTLETIQAGVVQTLDAFKPEFHR